MKTPNTLARLLKLLAPFRWWIALSIALGFATIGSGVGLMAMSAYLISRAAVVSSVAELSLAIAAVRLFALSRAALRYVERYLTHLTTFRILTRLRVWFYSALEPLAPARLQQYRSGDLLTRVVADIETLEDFYVRVVTPPVVAALVTTLACAILGAFDVWLAVALLLFLALTGVALPLVTQWLGREPSGALIATRAELSARMVDQIQGAEDLLAFGQEEIYQQRALALSDQLTQSQERLAVVRGLSVALGGLLASLAGLTILALAIPLVTSGHIDAVDLAVLPLTAIASFEAVQPLSLALQNLEASQAAARRLFELIDSEPAAASNLTSSPHPDDYRLVARNLTFAYAADEPPALEDISFTVPSGACSAVIGPSGAGKSTIAQLLLRFWDYQQGEIVLGGHDLRAYNLDDARALFSVIAQDTYLFNGTIRDNILLANGDASDEEIETAARQAQLHAFIETLPQGYDTLVGENGARLSGGERQRIAIARAILKDAPIWILDEPTAHLDATTAREIMETLRALTATRTTLILAHDLRGHDRASHVLRLNAGHPRENHVSSGAGA
ncbi:MAG TPA: thiol reductant ABC exporter subunit CydC [Ktedonobacterales bacterium]|jgi:ATP-binding cassette subfamily C protein CydC